MENKHMVYVHKRKTDGSVFYIGIGKGRRPYVVSGRNPHWKNVVAKNGLDVEIVCEGKSESCCKTIERILIQKFGLENLCNITAGGEGTSGWKPSEETRRKISKSTKDAWEKGKFDRVWDKARRMNLSEKMKGSLNPMSGKQLTEAHKKKISEALSGEKHPLYGKPLSEDAKKRISETLSGRVLSDAHKKAISNGLKGKKHSKETIEKRSMATENKEEFNFINCNGQTFTGTMRAFAKQFSLDRSTITKVVNGKAKSQKGWQLK
jgi:hypothetical protein